MRNRNVRKLKRYVKGPMNIYVRVMLNELKKTHYSTLTLAGLTSPYQKDNILFLNN